MARRFQANQHRTVQGGQDLQQLVKPGAPVLNREGVLHELSLLIQDSDRMFVFRDINPAIVHHGLLHQDGEARRPRGSTSLSALWVMRDRLATCLCETSRRAEATVF